MDKKRVIITGNGAVAGAIVRVLVPSGYDVQTIGLGKEFNVFSELGERSHENVSSILKGDSKINPLKDLSGSVYKVPHLQLDLSRKTTGLNPFYGADSVVLTAANPDSNQNNISAKNNFSIDRNSIDMALEAGARNIVLTSSLWRTARLVNNSLDELVLPNVNGSPPKYVPYAAAKVKSVRYLQELSKKHKNITFSYVDLGWYPRSTLGQPISNVPPRMLQWWIAECELQQHYLFLINIDKNRRFKSDINKGINLFGFNGFSKNYPPINLDHPEFAYDLSNSKRLGVKHEFNVYDVLSSKNSDWRRIPIFDD